MASGTDSLCYFRLGLICCCCRCRCCCCCYGCLCPVIFSAYELLSSIADGILVLTPTPLVEAIGHGFRHKHERDLACGKRFPALDLIFPRYFDRVPFCRGPLTKCGGTETPSTLARHGWKRRRPRGFACGRNPRGYWRRWKCWRGRRMRRPRRRVSVCETSVVVIVAVNHFTTV